MQLTERRTDTYSDSPERRALFANFAGLPGRPCAGPKRQYTAQQHVYQGVIPCNGVAPCGESPPVCRPITAREGFKIRTSYFVAALSASRETVRKAGRKAQRYAHIPRKGYTPPMQSLAGASPARGLHLQKTQPPHAETMACGGGCGLFLDAVAEGDFFFGPAVAAAGVVPVTRFTALGTEL